MKTNASLVVTLAECTALRIEGKVQGSDNSLAFFRIWNKESEEIAELTGLEGYLHFPGVCTPCPVRVVKHIHEGSGNNFLLLSAVNNSAGFFTCFTRELTSGAVS